MSSAFGLFNYWIVVALVMLGLYVVMANQNLVKQILGLNIFQAAVFILYISLGKLEGGTAPILAEGFELYDNPLPHVLILTAIVVGVSTTAVALAITVRIKETYGTIEGDEVATGLRPDLEDFVDDGLFGAGHRIETAATVGLPRNVEDAGDRNPPLDRLDGERSGDRFIGRAAGDDLQPGDVLFDLDLEPLAEPLPERADMNAMLPVAGHG